MTSADFLAYRNSELNPRPPQVRANSFSRYLLDLLRKSFGILRALQRSRKAGQVVLAHPNSPSLSI